MMSIRALRNSLIFLVAGAILIGGLVYRDIYQDRKTNLIIKRPIHLYSNWNRNSIMPLPYENRAIAQGESVRVLRIRFGKDYMAIKVCLSDKRVGWVFYDSNDLEMRRIQ